MSSTIESTWGGTAADSYISQADAELLIADFIWDSAAWLSSSEMKKDQALRWATRRIDMMNYLGTRYNFAQSLEWPRRIPFNVGTTIDQQQKDVLLATVFEAVYLVTDKSLRKHLQNMAAGLKQSSESVGPIRDQYTYASSGPATLVSVDANRLLARYTTQKKLYRS